MFRLLFPAARLLFAVGVFLSAGIMTVCAAPIIIDHTSIDQFYQLTNQNIDTIQSQIRWHYAHTSHGGQLTSGLSRIESSDSTYNVTRGSRYLPTTADSLNIFDGQESVTYITPDLYWSAAGGVQNTMDVLDHNTSLNVSQWSWCSQGDYYNTSQIQAYLNQMAAFEALYPDVTFVYMTSNAQATGSSGYNRFMNNQMIREWVQNSENRVLFDFADLDAWWFNGTAWEQETYEYNGILVPTEHNQFTGNESGHTTYESCEQKGRAVWVMMAELTGATNVPVPGSFILFLPALSLLVLLKRRSVS